MRLTRRAVAVALTTAVLAACGGGGSGGSSGAPSGPAEPQSAATITSAPTTVPAFVTPRVGECRGPISREIIKADSDARPTVGCDQPHGSETAFVDSLPAPVAALPYDEVAALTEDSPELLPILGQCREESDHYLGESPTGPDAAPVTNLFVPFYIPTAEEWAEGARWLRCDAVTEPFDGQATWATTESLRGILTRGPLPASLRACYQTTYPDFTGLTSCDQAHKGELMLEYLASDPNIDALGNDIEAIEAYIYTEPFIKGCADGVAAMVGVRGPDELAQRAIYSATVPIDVERWPADPKARKVWCFALVDQPTVGTLEGLGTKPVPRA